jgi:hypothetical protein
MITLRQLKVAALTGPDQLYTVSPNQKAVIKGLTVHNFSATASANFTLVVFGIAIYTTHVLAPLETFECASAINKFGLAADNITITPSAAVNVLGSVIEVPAK